MKALRSRAAFFVGLCLFQVPVAWLFDDFWVVDASSHFLPQQLILFFVSLTVWGWPRRKRLAVGLTALMATLLLFSGRIPTDVLERSFTKPPMRPPAFQLITFNVLTSNPEKAAAVEWIRSTLASDRPNVVVLIETDSEWIDAMKALEGQLPHFSKMPRGDNFGMAVYSSVPIEEPNGEAFEEICGIPQFTGRVKLAQGSVKLVAVHTVPPAPGSITYRNDCIREIQRFTLEGGDPAIATGDFNCAPWAACFPRGLKDSGAFLTRDHTWSILGGAVSTALDHVLHTTNVKVSNVRVGPDLGSDHLPVTSDVHIYRDSE